jgi:RNA polymerase sigma factor (TIGR02999 family)
MAEDPQKPAPGQLTSFLNAVGAPGDADALQAMAFVYRELHVQAEAAFRVQRPGHTLQPTALVHEAYLRLVGTDEAGWENRAHFFGAAARAIRRILVDRARARRAARRGGVRPLRLDTDAPLAVPGPSLDVLALDEALAKLATIDAQKARVVELRFFGGLSVDETADTLGVSASTVDRDWVFARTWLHRAMSDERRA